MKKRNRNFLIIGAIILLEIIAGVSLVMYIGANGLGAKDKENPSDITAEVPDKSSDTEDIALGEATETIAGSQNMTEDIVDNEVTQEPIPEVTAPLQEPVTIPEDVYDTITISAAGDVTLGRDLSFGYEKTFDQELELQNNDYGYFFRNVKDIFEADDLTIVNLETTLTTATKMAEKKYRFKADPSYVEILKEGDIEVVSIANNHTLDYLDQGYEDTLSTLEAAEVGYFGYEHKYITDIRGIKVGILGYTYWETSKKQKEKIKQAIANLREEGANIVIVMYHWGIERDYKPYSVQVDIAHFTIDSGADLVLGSHPHVVQGIEEYNGKSIIYSLGNFSFGGNKNPDDKDSMIIVHKFNFKNGELLSQENKVIPCSISSVENRNNYQPTPLEGEEQERVFEKIEKNSDF